MINGLSYDEPQTAIWKNECKDGLLTTRNSPEWQQAIGIFMVVLTERYKEVFEFQAKAIRKKSGLDTTKLALDLIAVPKEGHPFETLRSTYHLANTFLEGLLHSRNIK